MQLTITTQDDSIISVELDANDPVENLKAILEVETGVPGSQQTLYHNGRELAEGQTLGAQQVQPDDLILLVRAAARPQQPAAAPAAGPSGTQNPAALNPDGSAINPDLMMNMLSNPAQLSQLPPELADAVRSRNIAKFQEELRLIVRKRREAEDEERRFLEMAEADPFNPDVQRRLEEVIQQKNIMENFESALEHNPEAFGSVHMLYVNMEVHGVPLKAFIDSGAQMTIMGKSCAEQCGLLRLMDKRWSGMAVGVGKAKILGRIHMAPLKAGSHHFPVSITVLDQDGMDFLFGLDNLKRHQCMIDLKANCLRFGTTDTALPFLAEHEIPKKLEEHALGSDDEAMADALQQRVAAPPAAGAGPSAAPSAAPGHATPPAAAGLAAAAPGGMPADWEEKVQQLQALGFSREQCILALRQANGNQELAASLLFGMFD